MMPSRRPSTSDSQAAVSLMPPTERLRLLAWPGWSEFDILFLGDGAAGLWSVSFFMGPVVRTIVGSVWLRSGKGCLEAFEMVANFWGDGGRCSCGCCSPELATSGLREEEAEAEEKVADPPTVWRLVLDTDAGNPLRTGAALREEEGASWRGLRGVEENILLSAFLALRRMLWIRR